MLATPARILVVGLTAANVQATLERWRRAGWGWHSMDNVREAETVLKTIRFKVILAAENVRDGSGYELAPLVSRQSGNLFISIALSETFLWLPVIERGVRSLGKRALNPWMLETEVEGVLRAFDTGSAAVVHDGVSRGLASDTVLGAKSVSTASRAPSLEMNLLNPASSKNYSQFAVAKHVIPPRLKLLPATGGGRAIEASAPGEANRGSGTHGKRRAE